MTYCKICNSIYLEEIKSLLNKGISSRKIERHLKEKYDFRISYSYICYHRRNHVLPLVKGDELTKFLFETGNYRFYKKVERTKKIIKKYPKCSCNPFDNRTIKRRGLVFICSTCNGWLRGDVGRSVKREQKKQRKESRSNYSLGKVVRARKRWFE